MLVKKDFHVKKKLLNSFERIQTGYSRKELAIPYGVLGYNKF